jgi:hypothetical protein
MEMARAQVAMGDTADERSGSGGWGSRVHPRLPSLSSSSPASIPQTSACEQLGRDVAVGAVECEAHACGQERCEPCV